MIVQLREAYPWFDELLDWYVVGLRPRNYWTVLVLYSYFRHCDAFDVATELGTTTNAVYKTLERWRADHPGLGAVLVAAKMEGDDTRFWKGVERNTAPAERERQQRENREIMRRNREWAAIERRWAEDDRQAETTGRQAP